MFVLTYKVEMQVRTARKRRALTAVLDVSRNIHNAAIQERSSAWSKNRIRITKNDQQKSITALAGDPSLGGLPVNLLRWPLAKVDESYQGFFRRVKAGQKPGYPRFRSKDRYNTFGYTDRQCWHVNIDDAKPLRAGLVLSRIGSFRLIMHRPIMGEVRSLQVKREGRHWYALIGVTMPAGVVHTHAAAVGVDFGVRNHLTLSTGETIENINVAKRHAGAVRRAQRALARARSGSRSRGKRKTSLATLKCHEANERRTRLHQVSADLVRRYSTLIVEELHIDNMMRSAAGTAAEPGVNVRQKAGLNRSIQDASWGALVQMLSYKAERAGGRLVKVKPHGTSQECSACGDIVPKALSERRHVCACGADLDRDHNAALNVLHRGVAVPGDVNVGRQAVRRPGKVALIQVDA